MEKNGVSKDLDIIKGEMQKKFGYAGVQIYSESTNKLKINKNSSKKDIDKLISVIGESLDANHNGDSKSFCGELRQKLNVYSKFSPIFRKFLPENNKIEDKNGSQNKIEETNQPEIKTEKESKIENENQPKTVNKTLVEGIVEKEVVPEKTVDTDAPDKVVKIENENQPQLEENKKNKKSLCELIDEERNLLELLYQDNNIDNISKVLDVIEEDLADIILSLDNKGLIKMEDNKWLLTDSGKEIIMLEGKTIESLSNGFDCNYIAKALNINEEDLADIILSLDNKGLIKIENKKWILTESGKEIFDKRENLLKKLKIDYLHGKIKNRDEYNSRKKELEDVPQMFLNYRLR